MKQTTHEILFRTLGWFFRIEISKSDFPTRLDTILSTLNFASVNAHMFVLFQDVDDKRLHWIEQTTNYDRTLTSSARDESSTKPVWRWRVWSNSRTAIKMTIRDRDLRLSRLQVHGRVLRGRIEGFRKAVPGDSPADSHEAPTTADHQPSDTSLIVLASWAHVTGHCPAALSVLHLFSTGKHGTYFSDAFMKVILSKPAETGAEFPLQNLWAVFPSSGGSSALNPKKHQVALIDLGSETSDYFNNTTGMINS